MGFGVWDLRQFPAFALADSPVSEMVADRELTCQEIWWIRLAPFAFADIAHVIAMNTRGGPCFLHFGEEELRTGWNAMSSGHLGRMMLSWVVFWRIGARRVLSWWHLEASVSRKPKIVATIPSGSTALLTARARLPATVRLA
jgi:hypothetical protein